MMLLLDVLPMPYENPYAVAAAAVFFLALLAVAVVVFKILKRSVRSAFRMLIVAGIGIVAVIGSIVLLIGIGILTYRPAPRPAPHPTATPRPPANSTR